MPELPEVETMRRGIAPIVGSQIRAMRRPRSRLKPIEMSPRLSDFRRRVVGTTITAVRRIGKRVVIDLNSGDAIVMEPRMTGRVLLAEPPDDEHVRVVFDLSDGPADKLLFWNLRGLGVVRLLSPRQFVQRLGPDRLGPDALEISADQLRRRLESSRREIKVALLDQRVLAGVGNIYASELLHRARIHPQTPCGEISPRRWKRLCECMVEVLHEAIRCQGSTLSDGAYRTADDQPGGYQDEFRVYAREGRLCGTCSRRRIVRLAQAQRSTFYCPACQRRRSP